MSNRFFVLGYGAVFPFLAAELAVFPTALGVWILTGLLAHLLWNLRPGRDLALFFGGGFVLGWAVLLRGQHIACQEPLCHPAGLGDDALSILASLGLLLAVGALMWGLVFFIRRWSAARRRAGELRRERANRAAAGGSAEAPLDSVRGED